MTYTDAYIERWGECVAGTTPQERLHYGRFYSDAYTWCQGVAVELWPDDIQEYTLRVADCVATLSPLKPWNTNLTLALAACEQYAEHGVVTTEIGAMRARAAAALRALSGGGAGNGPKVSAFAVNIRGNLHDRVTIDRHMLAMVAPDLAPTPKRVLEIEIALFNAVACLIEDTANGGHQWAPAEVQAILWGWWRKRKGLTTYGGDPNALQLFAEGTS